MTNRASLRFRFIEWGIALVALCFAISTQAQVLTLQNPLPSPTQLTDISAMGSTLYAVGLDNTIIKSTDGGATWSQQYGDQPAIAMFNATFFRNANRGWAVGNANNGNGGFVEYTNNGGSTWGRQVIQQADYLKGVYFYNDTLGWTVGAGTPPASNSMPFIYYTTNGGNTWTRQSVGVPTSSNAYMNSVSFANNATGWAIGYDPNISGDFLLKTTNSGGAWFSQSPFFNSNETANSIATINAAKVFLGGDFGGLATIYSSTDSGATWSTFTFNGNTGVGNGTPAINGSIKKIVFPTSSIGYAAGLEDSNGVVKPFVLKTTNGGLSWKKIYNNLIMPQSAVAVNSLSAADANNVYLCGADNGGWVAATNDGGNSWSVKSYNAAAINGGINPVLYDASFVDLNNGWAVGNASNFVTIPVNQYNPVAVTTTNGGATWTPFPTMPKNPDNVYYTGVSTTSKQNIWICEPDFNQENAFVIHSTNAGATWNSTQVGVGVYPDDIKFSNDSVGILVGGSGESGPAYYTTDGGATWNSSRFYYEGQVLDLTRIGSFYGLTAWAIGRDNNGYIYAVTYDGGQSWYVTQTSIFGNSSPTVTYIPNGISFTPSGEFGWITGTEDSNGVYSPFIAYTNAGGDGWTEESDNIFMPNWASPTPPYVHTTTSQLDNVEDVLAVSALSAIAVTTQNNHSPYAGNRIIATVDGGNTWYNIDSSYVGTQYDRIAGKLTNRIDAWAVGQMGQIRHGYVNVPLFSAPSDSIFRKR
ncbi:MAG TPA: YCF48-related protein, partial [Candidatus Kapabacteria bacterium]|nr:YCF48-related protein [Candidatus Kapabacteria bacterium]